MEGQWLIKHAAQVHGVAFCCLCLSAPPRLFCVQAKHRLPRVAGREQGSSHGNNKQGNKTNVTTAGPDR